MGDDAKPKLPPPEPETPEMRFIRLAETLCMLKRGAQPEVIEHDARQMEAEYLRKYRNTGLSLLYDARGRKRTLKQKRKWIAEQIEQHRAEWTVKRPADLQNALRYLREFAAEHPEYADKARAVEALPPDADRDALNRILGARELTVEDVGVGFVESIAEDVKKRWDAPLPPRTKRRRFSNAERIAAHERDIAEIDNYLKDNLKEVEALLRSHPQAYRLWLRRDGFNVTNARKWHGLKREDYSGFLRRRLFYQKQIELGRAGVNLQDLWESFVMPHTDREVKEASKYLADKKAAEEQARREQRRKANLKRGQGAKADEDRRLQKALDIIHNGPPVRVQMKRAAKQGIKLNEPDIKKQPYVTKMILDVHKAVAKVFPRCCNKVAADVLNSWFQFHDHFLGLTADEVRWRIIRAKRSLTSPSK